MDFSEGSQTFGVEAQALYRARGDIEQGYKMIQEEAKKEGE
jgi:hypothetical protein